MRFASLAAFASLLIEPIIERTVNTMEPKIMPSAALNRHQRRRAAKIERLRKSQWRRTNPPRIPR